MSRLGDAYQFAEQVGRARTLEDLTPLLDDITREMGFRHFILGHHFDSSVGSNGAVVIHNCPESWADYFTEHKLHENDPVVRASEGSNLCFRWSAVPGMVNFTSRDREIMEAADKYGISNGCTIPFRKPGELPGSISFATPAHDEVTDGTLLFAQLIGSLAFEGARQLAPGYDVVANPSIRLTERQRECLILAAKGMTDAEIARRLGISVETASVHLKRARDRYGVSKRLPLAIRALYDGQIGFWEVMK